MAENLRLMFLKAHRFENGEAVRGAFLITDENTKPIEFRCTDPIRPSTLQKVLYGSILERHILIELIGKPLVASAREKVSVILVRDHNFLELRPFIEMPILHLYKNEETETVSKDAEENQQMITSDSGKFEPVVISTHKKFMNELNQTRLMLGEVFRSHDLLEPFERANTALEQVHKQKLGE